MAKKQTTNRDPQKTINQGKLRPSDKVAKKQEAKRRKGKK